jgi:outer membrane immunogenic protein
VVNLPTEDLWGEGFRDEKAFAVSQFLCSDIRCSRRGKPTFHRRRRPFIGQPRSWRRSFSGGPDATSAAGGGLWTHRDWNGAFRFGTFCSQTTSGGLGGVQAGCDYQVRNWVIGVAGDYDWSSASTNNLNAAFPLITDQANTKSLASLTFRTGYAWDRFLVYLKGGGAWLRSDLSIQTAGTTLTTVSDTREGWTIGVGGEYAFLDWLSAFVEYDYYNFRNENDNFACTAVVPCHTFINIPVSLNTNVNVIKIGVNVRFGPTTRW